MVDTISLITRTSIIRKKACAVHLILYEIKHQLSRQPSHILVSPLIIEAKGLSSHLENSDRSVFKRLQAYFGTRWLTSYDNRPTGYSRGSLPDNLPLKAFLTYCFFPFLFSQLNRLPVLFFFPFYAVSQRTTEVYALFNRLQRLDCAEKSSLSVLILSFVSLVNFVVLDRRCFFVFLFFFHFFPLRS